MFGFPVVTGGNDQCLTVGSATRQGYLARLASLDTYARLSPKRIEMAERFAYGTSSAGRAALLTVSPDCNRDGRATPRFKVQCQTRDEWLAARDLQVLSRWLADGKAEDMLDLPVDPHGDTER